MIYIIAFFLCLFSVLSIYSNREIKLLSIFFLLFLIVIFCGNNENPDYVGYKFKYDSIKNHNATDFIFSDPYIGFNILQFISHAIGLNYQEFLFIVALLGYALIIDTLHYFHANMSYVLLLYLFYPFFYDVIQIKNFLAMSIVIYSIRYLLDNTKLATLKYVVLIIVASLFHIVSVSYLLLLLTKLKKKIPLYILAFLSSISIAILIRFRLIDLLSVASILFEDLLPQGKLVYFNPGINYGFIVMTGIMVYCIVILQFISQKLGSVPTNANGISMQKSLQYNLVILMRDCNSLLFIMLFPMSFVNPSFLRIFRNFFILDYTCFYIGREYLTRKSPDYTPEMTVFFDAVVYIFVIGLFLNDFVLYGSESILKPMFTQNIFLNLLK